MLLRMTDGQCEKHPESEVNYFGFCFECSSRLATEVQAAGMSYRVGLLLAREGFESLEEARSWTDKGLLEIPGFGRGFLSQLRGKDKPPWNGHGYARRKLLKIGKIDPEAYYTADAAQERLGLSSGASRLENEMRAKARRDPRGYPNSRYLRVLVVERPGNSNIHLVSGKSLIKWATAENKSIKQAREQEQ